MSRRTAVVTAVVAAFAVIALPAAAYWAWSVSKSTSFSAASLAKPAGTATALPTSPPSIRISWSAPTGTQAEATYVVRRVSPAPAGVVCTVAQPETTTSCDDTNLTDLTPHTYTMEATLQSWVSGQSTSFGATSLTDDTTPPSTTVTFPAAGGSYNTAGWNGGCSPVGLCGTASDSDTGVSTVQLSLQRSTDSKYWDGSAFTPTVQTWVAATGTTSWTKAIAPGSLTNGATYTLNVRATDAAGNTSTPTSRTFTYDTSAPVPPASNSAVSTNGSGGTQGKVEAGDKLTLTFTEAVGVDPGSIYPGWTGASPLNIVVKATDGGSSNDSLAFTDASNVALTIGTITSMGSKSYFTGNMTYGATGTPSQIAFTSPGTFVITFGTASSTSLNGTDTGNNKLTWTTSASTKDRAGNAVVVVASDGPNTKQF